MNKEFLIRAGLVIFCLLFFSFKAAQLGYSIPDEKRYIQSVKEMVETRDWMTPRYHGKKRFEKPILFYWFGSLSSTVRETSIYAARFPSILFGAFTVLIVYLLGCELFDRRAGLISALLLATSGMFYMYSRFATPDAMLTFFITSALYFFIKGYRNLDKRDTDSFYAFFALMGLAALTKGPVGPLLVIIVATVFIMCYGKAGRLIKNMELCGGILVFLAIAVPWFLVMINIHGNEYIDHIWGVETLGRVANSIDFSSLIKAARRYILVIVVVNLMMSAFLPSAVISSARSGSKNKKTAIFLLGWALTVYLFFVFVGTKKGHYLLPASPALALLIGQALSLEKRDIFGGLLFNISIFIVIAASALGLAAVLFLINYMLGEIPWIYYFVVTVPLILTWAWVRKRDFAAAFIVGNTILMLFVMGIARPTLDNRPLQKFAGIIEPMLEKGDIVGVGSHVISHNRLGQYMERKVKKANVEHKDPIAHAKENQMRLLDFLTRENRVFCVVTEEDYQKHVSASLKMRLHILARENKWKKPNKIKFDKDLAVIFLTGEKDLFIDRVREEILLISNRK